MVPFPNEGTEMSKKWWGGTHVNLCLGRQFGQHLVQRDMHFLGRAFKEPATPANEQCIAGEDHLLVGGGVVHVPADTVLRVAWCM